MTDVALASPASKKISTKKKNLTLSLILLVAVLPLAAAYFMYFTGIGVPQHTVNEGHLLNAESPVNVSDLLNTADVERLSKSKRWHILLPVGQECNAKCEQNLYTTRQVHVRLSEKSTRLDRYVVNIGGSKGAAYMASLAEGHPHLKSVTVSADKWNSWLQSSNTAFTEQPFYLLVNQEGFAMMYYTADHHGNRLLKDIKRALKYSIDYQ